MKRKDISTETLVIQDGDEFEYLIEDSVNQFINDVESRINDAQRYLETIVCVNDLTQVESCLDVLKELSNDLY